MAENPTSQAQQSTAPWGRLAGEHAARIQALCDQLERLEKESTERAQETVEEIARLTRESIAHATRLSAEWRRMAVAAARTSADAMGGTAMGGTAK